MGSSLERSAFLTCHPYLANWTREIPKEPARTANLVQTTAFYWVKRGFAVRWSLELGPRQRWRWC